MSISTPILIFLVVTILIVVGVALLGKGKAFPKTEEAGKKYTYHAKPSLLSPAERSFFGVLQNAAGSQYYIAPKVGLADIVDGKGGIGAHSSISQKHVDFVLCDPETFAVRKAVELDDKSHERADRKKRDAKVDEVFRSAGIPLIHIPAQRAYKMDDVRERILGGGTPSAALLDDGLVPESSSDGKACPKCGAEMVLRVGRKGKNAGQEFWGCSGYPKCRMVVSLEQGG